MGPAEKKNPRTLERELEISFFKGTIIIMIMIIIMIVASCLEDFLWDLFQFVRVSVIISRH